MKGNGKEILWKENQDLKNVVGEENKGVGTLYTPESL